MKRLPTLLPDDNDPACCDFTLNGNSCWITVNNLSVRIKKDDDGVVVDIWPKGNEADEPIIGTWALYTEGNTNNYGRR